MTQSAAASTPIDLDTKRATRGSRGRAPLQPAGPLIKQRDLSELKARRDEVERLKGKVSEAEKLVQDAEAPILQALDAGGHIEPGPMAVAIKVDSRRIPKWRDEFERVLGADAAKAVIDGTEPTVKRKLVVSG